MFLTKNIYHLLGQLRFELVTILILTKNLFAIFTYPPICLQRRSCPMVQRILLMLS